MQFLLLLPIVLNIINISTAWSTFLRGRSKYGNLGEPILCSETYVLPEEQWFTQYLDHFNPSDTHVWKQVLHMMKDFIISYISLAISLKVLLSLQVNFDRITFDCIYLLLLNRNILSIPIFINQVAQYF